MPARFDELLSQRLAQLPAADGGIGGWEAVQGKLRGRKQSLARIERVARWSTAASVAVIACVVALGIAPRRSPSSPPALTEPTLAVAASTPAAGQAQLAQLRAQSQALEQVLDALPGRPAVARAGTAVPIDTLEAEVQWLDHQLSGGVTAGPTVDEEQLWRERVEVMNSLVRLRYAEAQQVAM